MPPLNGPRPRGTVTLYPHPNVINHMHLAKIIMLLLLVLAIMRVVSWLACFCASRLLQARRPTLVVSANGVSLGAYLFVLYLDRLPGEFLDPRAAAFGLVVFTLFALIDMKWLPAAFKMKSQPREQPVAPPR